MSLMEITITADERRAVLGAVKYWSGVPHKKYMTRKMLSEHAGIKDGKLRCIMQDCVDMGLMQQLTVTENPHRQRYMYFLTPSGETYLEES